MLERELLEQAERLLRDWMSRFAGYSPADELNRRSHSLTIAISNNRHKVKRNTADVGA